MAGLAEHDAGDQGWGPPVINACLPTRFNLTNLPRSAPAIVKGRGRAKCLPMALSKRLLQPPDGQLAGVKLTRSLNTRTVTV
jgi:hypothetical protein